MFPTIAKSRSQVKMSLRDYPESDQECIFMSLDTYPELFACRFPETVFKSEYKEWRLTKRGDSKFLLFKGGIISAEDRESITEWQERFSQYVLLGLNRHIINIFTTEINFCLALDYNFDTKNPIRGTREGVPNLNRVFDAIATNNPLNGRGAYVNVNKTTNANQNVKGT